MGCNMSVFEIWLDESGNFYDESKSSTRVPSLVGGVVLKGKQFTENSAKEILGTSKPVHAAELYHKDLEVMIDASLYKLKQLEIFPVVFENRERVSIVDAQTTYLSVFAEGIMQLIQDLSLELSDNAVFNLHIARRMYKKDNMLNRMKDEEYISRLQERILLMKIKNYTRSNQNDFKINIEIGSAREDRRLMVSDLICHAWYSKKYKFSTKLQEKIENHLEGCVYTIIEPGGIASIRTKIKDRAYAEGLYEWIGHYHELLESKNATKENINKLMVLKESICSGISRLNRSERNMQLGILANHIKALVNYSRKYQLAMSFFSIFFGEVIPSLNKRGLNTQKLEAEARFSRLTSAANLGEIPIVEEEIMQIEILIQGLSNRWENLDFISEYYIRKAAYLYAVLDYNQSVTLMNKMEEMVSGIAEISVSILSDEFKTGEGTVNSTLLGKIYGLRSQTYLRMGYMDENFLNLAENDCNQALKHFDSPSDKVRHFQTLAQISCQRKDFHKSEKCFTKSLSIPTDSSYETVISEMLKQTYHDKVFSLLHYITILFNAFLNGKKDFASSRFLLLKKRIELMELQDSKYPLNIVLFRIGACQIFTGETKFGINNCEKAIMSCFKGDSNSMMHISGLNLIGTLIVVLKQNNILNDKDLSKYSKMISNNLKKVETLDGKLPACIYKRVVEWNSFLADDKGMNYLNNELFARVVLEF